MPRYKRVRCFKNGSYLPDKPCLHGHKSLRDSRSNCLGCVKDRISRRKKDGRYKESYSRYWKKKMELEPWYQLYIGGKYRAKKAGLTFDLDMVYLKDLYLKSEICPVLGIKLVRRTDKKFNHFDSPTLDRIHPEKGYIKGNVAIISYKANRMKNNASLGELESLVSWLRGVW